MQLQPSDYCVFLSLCTHLAVRQSFILTWPSINQATCSQLPVLRIAAATMPLLPLLDQIESRFDIHRASFWMEQNWPLSIYVSLLYLMLVVGGRQWMRSKAPFSLRKMLVMWNTGLATFSICGTLTLVPALIRYAFHSTSSCYNFQQSCTNECMPQTCWCFSSSMVLI